jgi:hypothetical protein
LLLQLTRHSPGNDGVPLARRHGLRIESALRLEARQVRSAAPTAMLVSVCPTMASPITVQSTAFNGVLTLKWLAVPRADCDALIELQARGLVQKDAPQAQAQFVWALVHGIAMLAIDGTPRASRHSRLAVTRYSFERLTSGIGL